MPTLTPCRSDRDSDAAPPEILNNKQGAKATKAYAPGRDPRSLRCRGRRQLMMTSTLVYATCFRIFAKKGDAIGKIWITFALNRADHVVSDRLDLVGSEKNAGLGNVHGFEVFAGQAIALRRVARGIGVAREVRHPGPGTPALYGLHNLRLLEFRLA